jgi:hypothetical protein
MTSFVMAEVPDATNPAIDRNPTPPEQDSSDALRTYDAVTATSTNSVMFDPTKVQSGTQQDPYSEMGQTWQITTNSGGVGDSAVFTDALAGEHNNQVTVENDANGAYIALVNYADGTSAGSVTVHPQNWFSTIDRTSPHGVGSSTNGAKVQDGGCDGNAMSSSQTVMCGISGDGGIDNGLPTQLMVRASDTGGDAGFGYAILAPSSSSAKYFGVDYTFNYNITVSVDEANLGDLSTISASETTEIIVSCADANCNQDNVVLTTPTAFDGSQLSANGIKDVAEIYNTTTMIGLQTNTVKMTFGTASTHTSNVSANGVIYDPSVRIETGEPGLRMGVMEDGGMSWCDARWFMAKCDSVATFDGNSTNGEDGIVMKVTMPLETLYSMASYGGFDSATVQIAHPSADKCFNGEIRTHIMSSSEYDSSFSKNSLLKYLTSGEYQDVGTLAGFDSSFVVGTSQTDYCTGATSSISTTAIPVTGLMNMAKDSLLYSYNQGWYDVEERTFNFYVVQQYVAGASAPSSGQEMTVATTGASSPTIMWKDGTSSNPMLNSTGITRTAVTTGTTNPAFATPYVMYYSGDTPSDNVIAGRTLGLQENKGATFGGTQTEPDFSQRQNTQFAPDGLTPRSTIECGLASVGTEMVSSAITIYTNVDTTLHTGLNESEWKPYGVLNTNNSLWTIGPAEVGALNTGNLSVDNNEVNSGSSAVSFTGVFINGDSYKAVCEFEYASYDVGAETSKNVKIAYTIYFSASEDGDYSTGGGSDVEADEGWFDELDGYDWVIVGIALAFIFLALYMIWMGSSLNGLMDDRVAMILFGVGLIHAWISHHFYYDVADPLTEEWALIIGSAGYLVIALSVYLYGAGNTSMSERNVRYFIGSILLVILGVPTALTGLLNVDSDILVDVAFGFPVYDIIAGLGTLIGVILFTQSIGGLWRREGME